MKTEDKAWLNLFETILTRNGYYEKLRCFKTKRGINAKQMALELKNEYDDVNEMLSPYLFMDTIEDVLAEHSIEEFESVYDIVEYIEDNCLWKTSW